MGSTVGFWLAVVATVVAAVIALVSGFRGRRRLHLWAGPLTLVLLVLAVLATEALLRHYEFPAAALRFHLHFATAGALSAVPVAVTGLLLFWMPAMRRWHRGCVFVFVAAVATAAATGIWLFAQASPR